MAKKESTGNYFRKLGLKVAIWGAGMALWSGITAPTPAPRVTAPALPAEIKVLETTLPTEERVTEYGLERIVRTADLELSGPFRLQTERYTIVKDEDSIVTNAIGQVLSVPAKILLWDYRMGSGIDAQDARAVLSTLESNEKLKGVTVRLDHNAILKDVARLFNDPQVTQHNPLLARALHGAPMLVLSEFFGGLSHADYYNPYTQTAIIYSGIDSIVAHELGHHQDTGRFDHAWWYSMGRTVLPPAVALYQEWQASDHAIDIMDSEDQWQFQRFLIPALLTYVAGGIGMHRKRIQKLKLKQTGREKEAKNIDKVPKSQLPRVTAQEIMRSYGTNVLALAAGIGACSSVAQHLEDPFLAGAAFLAATAGTKIGTTYCLDRILPYRILEKTPPSPQAENKPRPRLIRA